MISLMWWILAPGNEWIEIPGLVAGILLRLDDPISSVGVETAGRVHLDLLSVLWYHMPGLVSLVGVLVGGLLVGLVGDWLVGLVVDLVLGLVCDLDLDLVGDFGGVATRSRQCTRLESGDDAVLVGDDAFFDGDGGGVVLANVVTRAQKSFTTSSVSLCLYDRLPQEMA